MEYRGRALACSEMTLRPAASGVLAFGACDCTVYALNASDGAPLGAPRGAARAEWGAAWRCRGCV